MASSSVWEFAKRLWKQCLQVGWDQAVLLVVALAGAYLSIYFGLTPTTEKRAAYEAVFLTGLIALALYIGLTVARELAVAFWKARREAQRQPIASEDQIRERNFLRDVRAWLGTELSGGRLHIARAFLFGSVVHDHYATGDIDLIVVLQSNANKSRAGERLRNDVAVRFKQKFNHRLHLEFKTEDELRGFLARAGKSEEIQIQSAKGWFAFT